MHLWKRLCRKPLSKEPLTDGDVQLMVTEAHFAPNSDSYFRAVSHDGVAPRPLGALTPGVPGGLFAADTERYRVYELAAKGSLSAFVACQESSGQDVDAPDTRGRAPLHHAAANGRTAVIDHIAVNGGNVDVRDGEGSTPLYLAVTAGHADATRALVHHGADVNALNDAQWAPLHMAASKNDVAVLKILCNAPGIDLNLAGDQGGTPLHFAAWDDSADAAQILLDHGANMCKKCAVGMYPTHVAFMNGSSTVIQVLIAAREKMGLSRETLLQYETQEKRNALHIAVSGGALKIVKLCLETGGAIDSQMDDGTTPVHLAAAQGALDILKLMFEMQPLKKLSSIDIRDSQQMTPLHKAAIFNRAAIAEYLIQQGANKDAVDVSGHTPVLTAAAARAWAAVDVLLASGACTGVRDAHNRNFLHIMILNGGRPDYFHSGLCDNKTVKQLLDETDNNGCTPLHYASKNGQISTIMELLQMGAALNAKNNKKQSPLHFAARYGRYNTCVKLLDTGQSTSHLLNETDGRGHTPVHAASYAGHVKVVSLLLLRGAMCSKDVVGNTPLHLAAMSNYTQCMVEILQCNPHLLDSTNKDGNTPLHLAAENGCVAAVNHLLSMGAKISRNSDGSSFFHLAIRQDHRDVCIAAITHTRWEEAMSIVSPLHGCPFMGVIRHMPDVCQMVLDRCRTPVGSRKAPDFHYLFNFQYLQVPHKTLREDVRAKNMQPLFALNMMVKYNRVECLSHPVCIAYLNMKWQSYGMWLHLGNLGLYLVFLASLTTFVTIFPEETPATPSPPMVNDGLVDGNQTTTLHGVGGGLEETTVALGQEAGGYGAMYHKLTSSHFILMAIIIAFTGLNVLKELVQMFQQKLKYLGDAGNLLEWVLYVSTAVFIIPFLCHSDSARYMWEFGAVATFLAWFNLLLFLRRFDFFGIYVVMFLEILSTLVQVLVVFSVLIVAFAMAFFILLKHGEHSDGYRNPEVSLMTTIVMMIGSIEYMDTWVTPYSEAAMAYPVLSFIALVLFILLMPILLINLMIGLAVGDIEGVQKNARLKRLAMQVEIHTDWERKLPLRILEYVDKPQHCVYPNCSGYWLVKLWQRVSDKDGLYEKDRGRSGEDDVGGEVDHIGVDHDEPDVEMEHQAYMYNELGKHKKRLKQISGDLAKQHDLLRLIVQKMEIHTEADDYDVDGANDDDAEFTPRSNIRGIGWSSPQVRQSLIKQASVINKWKAAKDNKCTT